MKLGREDTKEIPRGQHSVTQRALANLLTEKVLVAGRIYGHSQNHVVLGHTF
jgi:hypothetical protein